MDITAILVLSATLCSSDTVAALTMISQETQPRLFSVLFGEGIMNDAVSIIVFEVAINLSAEQGKTNKFLFNSFYP